ncbi:MAG: cupin domain-containing protein [Pseudomonadota bacterium]
MTKRALAEPTLMVDNDRVRVTRWQFAPGAATGWHVHEMDYVITPVLGQPVDIVDGEGAVTRVEMVPGQSYFREAGVAHDVINAGLGDLVFVETEIKPSKG